MARHLGVTRATIVRKFLYLAGLCRALNASELERLGIVERVQFDEMESFEHTRLKPLTVAIAMDEKSGNILSTCVAQIPAKGPLAAFSRKKYGWRPNHAPRARRSVLRVVAAVSPKTIVTDSHSAYPALMGILLPEASHVRAPAEARKFRPDRGRRNVADALFRLSHTEAKLRQDLSRLLRKSWVTTKLPQRLQAHLDLYVTYHNGYQLSC